MYAKLLKLFTARGSDGRRSHDWAARSQAARALVQQGKLSEAKLACDEMLALRPGDGEATLLLAEIAVVDKDLVLASRLYERASESDPGDALPHYKLANVLKDRGLLDAALRHYDRAVSIDPNYANAYCNRGVVLQRLNRLDEALASYEHGILLNPSDALGHFNRGTLLRDLSRPEDALASFDRAIAASPTYVAALYNRGMLLQERRQWDAALTEYDRALEIDPRFVQCHVARGNLQRIRKQWHMALADFDNAIAIDDRCAAAYSNKGAVLAHLKQFTAAFGNFDAAVGIDPGFAEAYASRGDALLGMNQFAAAAENYARAVALKPEFAGAHASLGDAHLCLKQFAAAIASYDRAIALKPTPRFASGMRRHAKMYLCDWSDLKADAESLISARHSTSDLAAPFTSLALIDSPPLHQQAALVWVDELHPGDHSLPAIPRRAAADKIRLGYFSSDFCEHPVAALAAPVLELHERSKYEVIGFSLGADTQDVMRKRLEKSFDQFVDVRATADHDVALLARSLGVDIAIDLNGHTAGSRTGIFALRAAPVQISFLGYPGTMGAEYIDYLIGDATVIPEEFKRHYTEKILYLPDSFLPYDSGRASASHRFTREQLGLPPHGIVFCCFNNSYKILPGIFDIWMRILNHVDDGVLWLSRNDATVVENLRREAQNRGVDPGRLIFAERMPSAADHLARLRAADLFLDTLPYNAHATALDALWSGVPLLTCIGQGFAGRVAASLLKSVGLPELITSTAAQYEDLAVELAVDPQRLAAIRLKLEQNRLTAPLFDTARFTRNLERAYARAFERYQAGLPPDHLSS